MVEPPQDHAPTMPTRLRRSRALVLELVAATLVAALVAAPLAVAWALSRTRVEQTVGVTPTTFSVTTAGHSELRLGVAGTLFLPRSRGPLGVVATVDGPALPEVAGTDLASYVTPDMLRLYTGLFHDPDAAVQEYVDLLVHALVRTLVTAELLLAALGGMALLAVDLLLRGRPPRAGPPASRRRRAVAAVAVVVVASTAVAAVAVRPENATDGASPERYALPALDGGPAAGTTTNSPVLQLLLGGAVPKVRQLIARQEAGVRGYRATALADLRRQAAAMTGPRSDETAVLMESDMHCNTTMTTLQHQVDTMLRARYGDGVPALLAITGDLTTNGTAAEGRCIEAEDAIAEGAPVAAVTGNHESTTSAEQMKAAGMVVLDGSVRELAGVSVLGAGDPERSELFGATSLRGTETEADVGERLRRTAEDRRPDLVMVHEAYAAQAFLGVSDMTDFLDARGNPTVRSQGDVPEDDVPAAAVFYGHWHRQIEPRVVWNSDGTWTLVMELDTSGGAIDTPTIGHFSTPWTRPEQEASFPVVFLDRSSGLVTGYQLYRFGTDGHATVERRVEVGRAAGAPTGAAAARASR